MAVSLHSVARHLVEWLISLEGESGDNLPEDSEVPPSQW
jgi:hypothetical protein